jgi:bicarbonate transport system substrate-binding protein
VLVGPLKGEYEMGDGKSKVADTKKSTLYWKDARGSVSYPYKSHDLWFLTESVRWGFLPPSTLDNAQAIVDSVNREDLWREAAQALGVPAADIPSNTSRGSETFFDGIVFDPENPQAYLNSLDIKRV